MPIRTRLRTAHHAVAQIFTQRCFYLFFALLTLIVVATAFEYNDRGRILFNVVHLLTLVAAVAAVGRSTLSFGLAFVFAATVVTLQILAGTDAQGALLLWSWALASVFYVVALGYLLGYVFQEEAISADKLWGAAAAYLMLGILWMYGYGLVQAAVPQSFSLGGSVAQPLSILELLYFSMTVLTSTGFGDIVPLSGPARALVIVQEVFGVLFVAILIARLAGIYPPQQRGEGMSWLKQERRRR